MLSSFIEAALGLKSNTDHNHDDRYHTKNEISALIGDRITLAGLSFTLQSYATTASQSDHITSNTENYVKKVDVFSNSIRLGWKESGDQQVMVPNLVTFQALLARVEALEASNAILESRANTTEQATDSLNTVQDSIWQFTQNALTRLNAGGL